MGMILALLLTVIKSPGALEHNERYCEVIELNRMHEASTLKPSFEQLIFWRRYPGVDGLHVASWIIFRSAHEVRNNKPRKLIVYQDGPQVLAIVSRQKNHVERIDGELVEYTKCETRIIRAKQFIETSSITENDPEVADRERFPVHRRIRLFNDPGMQFPASKYESLPKIKFPLKHHHRVH